MIVGIPGVQGTQRVPGRSGGRARDQRRGIGKSLAGGAVLRTEGTACRHRVLEDLLPLRSWRETRRVRRTHPLRPARLQAGAGRSRYSVSPPLDVLTGRLSSVSIEVETEGGV